MIVPLGIAQAGVLTLNGCGSGGAGAFVAHAQSGLSVANRCPGGALQLQTAGTARAGASASWQTTAPAGIVINHFWVGNDSLGVNGINDSTGYGGGFFWQGGGAQARNYRSGYSSPNFSSQYMGWHMVCGWSSCPDNGAFIRVYQIQVLATENSGPGLTATTPLFYARGWIRGSWPLGFASFDPSGTCNLQASIAGQVLQGPTASLDHTRWHQCPDLSFTQNINTAAYPDGPQPLVIQGENAAGVWTSANATARLDNSAPTISLVGPDQGAWIGHGAVISVTAAAGPSGVSGITCSVDGQGTRSGPTSSTQIAVDGTGQHRVTCWSANGSADASGQVAQSSPATRVVKIDETPPRRVTFEPQNPSDPQQLVVDASNDESGVASGTIQMRPVGGQWRPLPTQFDGQHLLARFNDARLHGDFQFQATACDVAGNCTTTMETLALPVRIASVSDVFFSQLQTPAVCRSVRERVLVGWHWVSRRVHGQVELVKQGGHLRVITVTRCHRSCTSTRVVVRGRSQMQTTCAPPRIVVRSSQQVAFGHALPIHGLLMTAQGLPLAGRMIRIFTAPDDGHGLFSPAASATTMADGEWRARLAPGPSRLIRASYTGSSTLLPSTGTASTIVPASVRLTIRPQAVAWGSTISISGQLLGGHIPPAGEVLFIRLNYQGKQIEVEHVRTARSGAFRTSYTFLGGAGTATYPFWATTVPESDYPFATGSSRKIDVTVGP